MPELFPYQKEGAAWLSQKKYALLADEMGLGKSAQAITAADLLNLKTILVLCPAVARPNWRREFEKFSVFDRKITTIKTKSKLPAYHELVICSYDLAEYLPENIHFDLVIADESHYLKSIDTIRTKAVLGAKGLIHRTKYFWALSGTPAPNHPGELWPLLFSIGAIATPYSTYVKNFCTYYIHLNRMQITGAKVANIPRLKQHLDPIMLRRKKDDVLKDLPSISFNDIFVEPNLVDIEIESSFAQYTYPLDRREELNFKLKSEQLLVETATRNYDTPVGSDEGLAALAALAQSVSTLRRYNGLQKVEAVAELVDAELKAKAYEKIVIFAIHRDVIEGLRSKLYKHKPVTLYGGTPLDRRQENIDTFQDPKSKCKIFIGQILAAGTAITLTTAHHVLFIEQDWVPGNNMQAAMRCHRIGQTKPVFVRFVGLENSIDGKIAAALKRKTIELAKLFEKDRAGASRAWKKDLTPTLPDC